MTVMTKSLSWVATMYLPLAVKKASSGAMNVWPGARSPGWGHSQVIWPSGFTTISRLLFRSAMRIGPGRTEGFDPGWRWGPVSGVLKGAAAAVTRPAGDAGTPAAAAAPCDDDPGEAFRSPAFAESGRAEAALLFEVHPASDRRRRQARDPAPAVRKILRRAATGGHLTSRRRRAGRGRHPPRMPVRHDLSPFTSPECRPSNDALGPLKPTFAVPTIVTIAAIRQHGNGQRSK